MGTLVAVADHGHVKACADDPRVDIPPREDGKLDVGGAVGHNAIALIIPCHRVVGADGSLTGYAGGLDRKARLLTMENPDFLRSAMCR